MSGSPKSGGGEQLADAGLKGAAAASGPKGEKSNKSPDPVPSGGQRQTLALMPTLDSGQGAVLGLFATAGPAPPGSRSSAPGSSVTGELRRGTTIGRYLITERLGAGGMGVVYAAYDPELDRKVAIKLLHAESWSSDSTLGRARLLREAQAMARLSHPNVIAVFDVGTFRDQVFVAMELIDGHTLTDWLTAAPRTRQEILRLFIQAGRGLRAAHEAGLIHRDFKPDNVLVGRDGRVRVTDFGLARNLSEVYERATGHNLRELADSFEQQPLPVQLTQPGALLGTPRYMAPEQYCGEPLSPRTDQFSFCVALFEALHGQAPFAGDSLATLCYNVLSGNFAPTPPTPRVPAWLRAVVLRGLQQDPERRYPDMDALLEALARDPERRLVRIVVTALVIVGGVILGAGSTKLAGRGSQLCQGAEQKLVGVWDAERRQATRAAVEAAAGADASELWPRIERGLDAYTGQWVAMYTEACLATHSRGEQSQQLLDLRMRCLGRRLQDVSAFTALLKTASRETAEQAVAALSDFPPLGSCADIEALSAPQPPPEEPARRAEVERLYRRLSELWAQERVGHYAQVAKDAAAVAEQAERTGYKPLEAEAWFLLSELQNNTQKGRRESDALFRAALAGIAGHNLRIAAQAFTLLAAGAAVEEDYKSALQSEQLAAAALTAAGGDEELRARLLSATGLRALQQQRLDEALRLFREALALRERLQGPVHPGLIKVLGNMAWVLQQQGQFESALALRMRALHISELQLGPWHPQLAVALSALGRVLRAQGSYKEAQDYYERALHIEERALGPAHPRVGSTLREMGSLLLEQGLYQQATPTLRRALAITKAQPRPDEEEQGRSQMLLATALRSQGLFEEALALQDAVLERRRAAPGAHPGRVSSALVSRCQTRLLQKDLEAALRDAQQAVEFAKTTPAVEPGELAEAHQMLGRVLLRQGNPTAAQPELQEALRLREKLGDSGELGSLLVLIADGLIALNQPAAALPLLERALQLRASRELATVRLRADASFAKARALLALARNLDSAARQAGSRPVCTSAQAALGAARAGYLRLGNAARAELQELEGWATRSGCQEPGQPGSAPAQR